MTQIERRRAIQADLEFLYALHKQALGPYVDATWGWDDDFQRRWFEERFDPPANELILLDSKPVGCLRVTDRSECVFLDSIALVPDEQRRGLGSQRVR